ncbi:hypothetical protein GCM10009785_14470 [Brooklawnia cerclae]|uniref:Uncharacterized protein n=1 Tax=Brooklawnia cerclae TaxID=349934 RepID=A0ABX0SKY0_9ACTN|nr:hypothetical protein [Brooklawnia cerclae]NIH57983.1 hypothetical protein [Brooklawnia cerclae]
MVKLEGDQLRQQFLEARAAYLKSRRDQRGRVVEALRAEGFEVKNRGNAGRGLTSYTSGGRLEPSFDLSGWLWVEARRGDVIVVVSLQTLDQDPKSKNIHVLMDRIGVDVFRDGDPVDPADPLREKTTTRFELPLSSADLAGLVALVKQRVAGLG